jgi:septum formation protein
MDMRHTWGGYQVVLASASPRRKELLAQIGLESEIRPSRMEEETGEKKPDRVVMELSRQKAEDVASGCPAGTMVIGADTVVSVGNEILGKPGTPMRAYEMLEKIQGRTHQVYTEDRCHGITFAERTDVHVYPMTCGEMKEYAQCGEPLDKAGAYGIQGRFAAYIKGIEGDYANVVGLPVGRLYQEIKRLLEDREDD